jgi:serine/threonine-protein kinase
LTSPHSIAIYDFGFTDEGTFYYVMEVLDGRDLASFVERFGPLPPSRTLHVLKQVCESLSDAHHLGLIHRDIKPANIFLCRMGRLYDFVKVLDFGLVKWTHDESKGVVQLTQEGAVTGTPAFLAPEQALGKPADARTDLYALGCVGYWLLTGKLLFDSTNMMAQLVDHVKTAPVPPSQRVKFDAAPDLERVILRCLEKDPSDRPSSAEELSGLLEHCEDFGKWGQAEATEWWRVHFRTR